MKALRWVAVLFLLTVSLGCSHIKEYVDIVREDSLSFDYFETLNRNTQEKTLYSEFETKIRVVSTHKSPEFREAYLTEFSRLYILAGKEEEERQVIISGASSDFDEFLFYAYTPDIKNNDFPKAGSIWKIFSIVEGGKLIEPLDIREIEVTTMVKKFFPYVKPYGKFYSVKFPPLPPSGGNVRSLVFTGVVGKVELGWIDENNP